MPADFLDSNVLLYAASGDDRKADRADALLAQGGTISVQVLNEFASVARRKMNLSWAEIDDFVQAAQETLDVRPLDLATHNYARDLAGRYQLHIYDACIVAAALLAGCGQLHTEDLQDGAIIDGRLRIVNPFA